MCRMLVIENRAEKAFVQLIDFRSMLESLHSVLEPME